MMALSLLAEFLRKSIRSKLNSVHGDGSKKNKNGWLSEIKFWILPVTKRIIMGILNFSAN